MMSVRRLLLIPLLLLCGIPAVAGDSAVVLMYHRFGEDQYPSTNIRIAQFEAQLKHLRENAYTVVSLADVMASRLEGRSLPRRAVAITVDDAYRSVYTVAFPRLREAGYPFTVFVATDPVDEGLPAFMSWEQMREMASAGVSFANHGATHRSLISRDPGEPDAAWLARIRADIQRGEQRLRDELKPLPGAFAYPYGEYDTASAELVRELGYVGFGQQSGALGPTSDRRALPRFPMAESYAGLDEFRTRVASLPLPVIQATPWNPVVNTARPRLEITLADTPARLDQLACFISGQGQTDIEWLEPRRRFSVGAQAPLSAGRQRVNCTAPGDQGRYFWFSHPWVVDLDP